MGNFAPTVTTGLVLFNVIVFVLITAFAMDDIAIGRTSNVYSSINSSGQGLPGDVSEPSFLERFGIVMWGLPWWLNTFVIFVNALLIPITILAWVRGL